MSGDAYQLYCLVPKVALNSVQATIWTRNLLISSLKL